MGEYRATVAWSLGGEPFVGGRYGRGHEWRFDGGVTVLASASPQVVPEPFSVAAAVDPEEAFVAALSSCHMLWFLSVAARSGFVVERYVDRASGSLAAGPDGGLMMTKVVLRPRVTFSPVRRPSEVEHARMHDEAHRRCFLARSVRTTVTHEPVDDTDADLEPELVERTGPGTTA